MISLSPTTKRTLFATVGGRRYYYVRETKNSAEERLSDSGLIVFINMQLGGRVLAILWALLLGSGLAAAVTIREECIDDDKKGDNLGTALTADGGPTDSTAKLCKSGGDLAYGIFKGHTSVSIKHGENRACYDITDADEFKAAGCGVFTRINTQARQALAAIKATITASIPQTYTVFSPITGFDLVMGYVRGVCYTGAAPNVYQDFATTGRHVGVGGAEWPGGQIMSGQKNELRRLMATSPCTDQLDEQAFRQLLNLEIQAPADHPTYVRAVDKYARHYLRAISSAISTVEGGESPRLMQRGRARDRHNFIAVQVKRHQPFKWYSVGAESSRLHQLGEWFEQHIPHKMDALVMGTLAGHTTFYTSYMNTAAKQTNWKCLPILHAQVGLNTMILNDDSVLGCASTSKTLTARPACARLAVAQLLNFNRHPSYDTKAPWKLVAHDFGTRHTAIKMNAANYLKAVRAACVQAAVECLRGARGSVSLTIDGEPTARADDVLSSCLPACRLTVGRKGLQVRFCLQQVHI